MMRKPDDELYLASMNKNADQFQKLFIFNHSEEAGSSSTMENIHFYPKTQVMLYKMNDPKQIGQAFESMWESCQNFKDNKTKFLK